VGDTTEHHGLKFTVHAFDRFAQRVRKGSYKPAYELDCCLQSAKPKHLRKAKERQTYYVPLGCCMLICEHGTVVTVLARNPNDPLPKRKQQVTTPPQLHQCPYCPEQIAGKAKLLSHMAGHCKDFPKSEQT
jgi:hypothetical protein